MGKVKFLVSGIIAVLLCASTVSHGADLTIFGSKQKLAPIVVREKPVMDELSGKELRALSPEAKEDRRRDEVQIKLVEDFVYHLEKMTGSKPEILVVTDVANIPTPAIVLGDLAVKLGAEPKYETTMIESFRILTKDDRVLIGGESIYGTGNGIYEFLRTIGCDWIFPGPEGEVIPQVKTLIVPDLDIAKKPAFEVRSPWYSGGRRIIEPEEVEQFYQWCRRQQQTFPRQRRGDHPTFLGGGHYWHGLIRRNKELLEKNPEMRALTRQPDGSLKRTWSQLDAAHPGVVEMTVKDIRATFEKNNWPKDYAIAMSISPNDGGGYSVSPDSMAAGADRMDPVTGDRDQTDIIVYYANKVLEELEDEFPNLYLGFYLYSVHAEYPMRYKPHPHLTINIADITYSRFHSLLDPSSPTRTYYRGILEQWGKLHKEQGNPMSFYGYNWNLAENLMPYSKMKIWGQDLPYYHKIGVVGHNNEQDKAWSILGPHNYLMARMGWDIDLDWREVLTRYCKLAFGAGGPDMEAYYLDLIDTQESAGYEAGGYGSIHLIFDRDFIARSRDKFAKAAKAAKTDFHKRNVDYYSQPVTALELYLNFHDAINRFDFVKGKAAYDAMIAHWDEYNGKNTNLVSRYGRRYIETWLFKPFIENALKYSTGDYKLLYALPDELPTIMDPNIMGQFMNFYHPALRDEGWMKTMTYSTTWESQGLGPYRQGAVWYRQKFKVPEKMAAEGVGLLIGAVEDEVHVWCNGDYIGKGRGFIKSFTFDLTDNIKPGEDNLIALQVIRRGMINELQRGGLMYPSFVFTGPRLEEKAPTTEPLYRILPGGAREPITK